MAQVVLDPAQFRELFNEFSDASKYPDACIQMYWDMATCYISDQSNQCLSETCLQLAINLLTAHLLRLSGDLSKGGGTGLVTSATIDDVSVTTAIPDVTDQFNFWINQSGYGQQYYALLSSQVVGGFYVGGNNAIPAFRGPTGGFNA